MWANEIESIGGQEMLLAKHRLLEIFKKTSFKSSPDPIFRLASKKQSKYYVDCKQALSDPEARALIGKLIFALIRSESFDSIGGLELGAYPVATSVSDTIFRETRGIVRAFVIRKAPKSHGVTDLIAGHVIRGDQALIVDDVVTTGASTIQAIESARKAGLEVKRAIVLVDREEEDGKAHIEAAGVKFDALLTLSELLEESDDSSKGTDERAYNERLVRHQSGTALVSR
jgi:orotate phosphoribosyltransferase